MNWSKLKQLYWSKLYANLSQKLKDRTTYHTSAIFPLSTTSKITQYFDALFSSSGEYGLRCPMLHINSNGPSWIRASPPFHLWTGADPDSEMQCSFRNRRQYTHLENYHVTRKKASSEPLRLKKTLYTPWRRMVEWQHNSNHSQPPHYVEVRDIT